jgi:hypothetical protein
VGHAPSARTGERDDVCDDERAERDDPEQIDRRESPPPADRSHKSVDVVSTVRLWRGLPFELTGGRSDRLGQIDVGRKSDHSRFERTEGVDDRPPG